METKPSLLHLLLTILFLFCFQISAILCQQPTTVEGKFWWDKYNQETGKVLDMQKRVLELEIAIQAQAPPSILPGPNSPASPTTPSNCDSSRYIATINQLRSDVRGLRNEIGDLKGTISQLRHDTATLHETIKVREDTIYAQGQRIEKLKDSLQYYKDIVSNVLLFEQNRREKKETAAAVLEKAEHIYNTYSTASGPYKDSLRMQLWNIYSNNRTETTFQNCGPFNLLAIDDLKRSEDHYYMASLLIDDNGTIFNKMGADLCSKVRKMNAGMLSELGQTLENANQYSLKSDVYDKVEKLSSLLIAERKCWNASGEEVEFKGTNAYYDMKNIKKSFEAKDFATTIGIYNRYYRLMELDEVKKDTNLIAEIKYHIGSIMLWNLGGTIDYRGLTQQGSWLKENYGRRIEVGQNFLIDAIKLNPDDKDLIEKAYILTRKKY